MSCCGQHRNAARVQAAGTVASSQVAVGATQHHASAPVAGATRNIGAAAAPGSGIALQCRARVRMQVRGPVTGRTYLFEPTQATSVDARDADILLRSRQFLRTVVQRC